MKRESYQMGTVRYRVRRNQPGVWELTYRRYLSDGTVQKVTEMFADDTECPTQASALKSEKLQALRERINAGRVVILVRDLARQYVAEHISTLRAHVQVSNKGKLRYFVDRFGDQRLDEIVRDGMSVQMWLNGKLFSTKNPKQELARNTRHHIRNLIHHMFGFAKLCGYITHHPFAEVSVTRGGRRPVSRDFVIEGEMYRFLMADEETPAHVRMMILVAMQTGLRADEFLALKWEDIDFEKGVINICRGVVGKDIQETKTADSAAPIPMHGSLADALLEYRQEVEPVEDWVFGSIRSGRPFHLGMILNDYLRPALHRMGVEFGIEIPPGTGFHAMRHTYITSLDDRDTTLAIQQRLARHSDAAMTLKYIGKSRKQFERLRAANASVVDGMRRTGTDGD